VFRRRRHGDTDEAPDGSDVEVPGGDATSDEGRDADGAAAATGESVVATQPGDPGDLNRNRGPWDDADAPDDGLSRLDLGGIRVPIFQGMELRVEFDQPSQQVTGAAVATSAGQLQIAAFAAPRSAGIWDEVREEIAASLRDSGAPADEVPGVFGTELHTVMNVTSPGGVAMTQPARFYGIDGPRWFLRGLLIGPAAADPAFAAELERVLRDVVVVRGGEAMAPRDLIPLRLPPETVQAAEAAETAEAGSPGGQPAGPGPTRSGDFNPFERGPEITEVR
jgi:hypothetical protein